MIKFWFFQNKILKNIYNLFYVTITELDLWEYLKCHNIKCFITHPYQPLKQVYSRVTTLCLPNDMTFQFIMKQMQKISQMGYNLWEYKFIETYFPEYLESAKKITNKIYDILSSPYYLWGRKRIMKDFSCSCKLD